MKINSKYVLLISSMLSSWLFINGCSNTLEAPSEKIILQKGAIAREENGNHTNYNLTEGKYNKLEIDKAVAAYDIISGNYIYEKEGSAFIHYKDEDMKILDKNIINPKLSSGGDYYSYFKKDKYMQLVVKSLKDNKEIEINTNVAISGNLMDWSNNIIYYGIDENKTNGIFSYNISNGKEELIYKLESGYLEFLKASKDGIVFLQGSLSGKKILKSIDKEKNIKIITDEIVELRDIEISEKGIFILGKMKNDNQSIYEVKDGKVNRLIYDFPNIINLKKGLSSDEVGNVLFIGSTDSGEKENIYICEDGYVKVLTNDNLKYYFVDIK
ncbi:hypothetical protein J1C67_14440 [Clostridium gasigenes]|uniref:hypothetical protein n=1 Tax=Clostridium gasigenes TaxID=94869 RepID=UPI001438523B|nr:hypothetical protein [Clostridium gasigenes]NKF05281.1 hypothetical protein [Clostridium gasigenes]QSW18736.1 hypothetical protein J1C67_14440 [Clostridium gasigenes]